jgi:hypothetical protein
MTFTSDEIDFREVIKLTYINVQSLLHRSKVLNDHKHE